MPHANTDKTSNPSGWVSRINPLDALGILNRDNVRQINSDSLSITPHENTLQLFVLIRLDLLMWNIRRHINEISCPGLRCEFETVAPAHPSFALDNVDHTLEMAVVMRASL